MFEQFKHKILSNGAVQKIRSIKNIEIIALVFIIAMGLIIYSSVASNKGTESDSVSSLVMTDNETRLASILSELDGVGMVQVLITESDEIVVGVLVVAEGAENPVVAWKIVDAVSGALCIDRNIVDVYKMNN